MKHCELYLHFVCDSFLRGDIIFYKIVVAFMSHRSSILRVLGDIRIILRLHLLIRWLYICLKSFVVFIINLCMI